MAKIMVGLELDTETGRVRVLDADGEAVGILVNATGSRVGVMVSVLTSEDEDVVGVALEVKDAAGDVVGGSVFREGEGTETEDH